MGTSVVYLCSEPIDEVVSWQEDRVVLFLLLSHSLFELNRYWHQLPTRFDIEETYGSYIVASLSGLKSIHELHVANVDVSILHGTICTIFVHHRSHASALIVVIKNFKLWKKKLPI